MPKGVTVKGIDCTNETHFSYSGTYSAKSHGHSPKLCKCLAAAGSSVRQREVCSYLTVYKAEGVYRERLRLPFLLPFHCGFSPCPTRNLSIRGREKTLQYKSLLFSSPTGPPVYSDSAEMAKKSLQPECHSS